MTDTGTFEVKADVTIDDAGTVTGLAWPFGKPDSTGDLIEPTAFSFAPEIPMIVEHEQRDVVGIWNDLEVTAKGLEVKGRLFVEGVEPARKARRNLKAGIMRGLSIGYQLHEAKARPEGGRILTDLTITEISLCKRPVHPDARTTEVKSIIKESSMEEEMNPGVVTPGETVVSPASVGASEEVKALKALQEEVKALKAKANRPVGTVQQTENAAGDFERKAFVDFARRGVERMEQKAATTLVASDDSQGGYLAPQEFGNEILKSVVEFSPIRSYARVITISSGEVTYPRKVSGTTASWLDETAAAPQSDMTFEQVSLKPYRMGTFADISSQLLEDNAYNLEGELAADLGESFGKMEAAAFVSGDGNGKPTGLLEAPGIAEVTTGNAGTLGTDPAATIIGMFHKVPSVVAQNGAWMMNRATLGTLRSLKDDTGRFILLDPISAGAPATLLGRPIVECIDMPDIDADEYPIVFGDFSGYRIVDRVGLTVLRDAFTQATKGVVRFVARRRVGGDVTNPDRFLKLKVAA